VARFVTAAVAASLLAACAARLPARPAGASTADPSALAAFAQATATCAGLRTLTAELGLSGQASGEKLRGRVIAGLQAGGAARLEGVAPFGPPVFILAARDESATLLLPREHRVLTSAPVAAVVERLTGVALGAEDLRRVFAACPGDAAEASEPRKWASNWRAVTLPGNRTAYLRDMQGRTVVQAVDYGAWHIDYDQIVNDRPRVVRIRDAAGQVDLTARIDQLEVNVAIDAAAFEVTVPPGTDPMTLDELRSVAPLRATP
jgi:outer membrane biogenesis lipoprotein LolB